MREYKMWINGGWVGAESGKTYTVVNPATEEVIAKVPLGDKADVNKAVEAARKAFPTWAGKSQVERSDIMNRIAHAIREHAAELAEIETMDHGIPQSSAIFMSYAAAEKFEWAAYASKNIYSNGDVLTLQPGNKILLQREPIGVSALITPWNAPLLMVAAKLSVSLSLGNTCVVKPASITSLSTLKLGEILEKLDLPAGIVNIITGPGSTVGEALSTHPDVGLIGFTGSCETGKRIMELASRSIKRVQLELGGKNPVIVLEDADVDTAAEKSVSAQLENTGQVCASPGRFYVHTRVYDEFLEKFISGANKFIVGSPDEKETQIGPVVSAEHRDHIEKLIKRGIEEGANLVLGGKRPTTPPLDKGYYVMPAVFTGVKQSMTIAREEIFGPVACFMEPFSSDDEVIELANDNAFGLSAYVWTRDTAKGLRFADRICAGTVRINKSGGPMDEVPWGGFKESGIGKDGSKYGLEDFTQLKVISVDTTA